MKTEKEILDECGVVIRDDGTSIWKTDRGIFMTGHMGTENILLTLEKEALNYLSDFPQNN